MSARQGELLSWVEGRREVFVEPRPEMPELTVQISAAHPSLTNYAADMHGVDLCVIALAVMRRREMRAASIPSYRIGGKHYIVGAWRPFVAPLHVRPFPLKLGTTS